MMLHASIKDLRNQWQSRSFNVLSEHIDVFRNVGFRIQGMRKCMIRPTEKLMVNPLAPDSNCDKFPDHLPSIIQLMKKSYSAGLDERALGIPPNICIRSLAPFRRRDVTFGVCIRKQIKYYLASSWED